MSTQPGQPMQPVPRVRFAGPLWRIAGAVTAWVLFAFSFTVLYQAAAILSGIGGYCASGGPYVIETECPDVLNWAFPVGFFGTFIAWGIGLVFQRGFAAPVVVWGWPVLFVGLGIEFFVSIPTSGLFVGILCGGLFVIMGLAPLIFELRAGPARIILGKATVTDVRFVQKTRAPRTFYAFGRDDAAPTVTPTFGDWVLSLAVTLVSIAGGVVLGLLAVSPHVVQGWFA